MNIKPIWFALCLIAIQMPSIAAPHLSNIYPAGGQRGTSTLISVSGTELAGITGFYTEGKGLTAKVLPGKDAGTRSVQIVVAKDAPLGIQQIRFYDAVGISNPRYFLVGAYPEVMQVKPSNTLKDALKVTLPITVNGRIRNYSQQDATTFHATMGQTIVCEVQALRILADVDNSWLKGYMEIQDSAGYVLASNNGTSDNYYRWDPLIAFDTPRDGDYTVFFHDLNWRGGPSAVYRLTIGVIPHALAIFPLGGQRGKTVAVHFIGPNLKDATQQTVLASDSPDKLSVAFTGAAGTTNSRPLQVSDLPSVMQNGMNHSRDHAQIVPLPCIVDGCLEKEQTADYYKFHVDKKLKLAMEVFSRRLGTPMDSELTLYDANGKTLSRNDDDRGKDSRIETDLDAGDYTVTVHDIDNRSGPAFDYRLWISVPQPILSVRALPDAPSLARGGTTTLNIHIDRQDGLEGEVSITASGLPSGITATPVTIAKDKQDGQITFAASLTARPGPLRLELSGIGHAGSRTVKTLAHTEETYNTQGTAFQRELIGPIILITNK